MLEYVLGNIRPLSILLQSRVLWLKPIKKLEIFFAFSGHISADSDAKIHDLYEPVRRK
jgi:hypothetical protein